MIMLAEFLPTRKFIFLLKRFNLPAIGYNVRKILIAEKVDGNESLGQ